MKTIKKHLKDKQFVNAYLLYGEERFLIRQYRNALAGAICGEDDMNLSCYEGKSINLDEIKDIAMALPFFAERRLIIIENSGMFINASDTMVDIFKKSLESTFYIFVENEVDKRNKMYKRVNEKGYVCEFKELTESELMEWAFKYFKNANKQIMRSDMQFFIQMTGPNMDNIYNETMKLIAYCLKKDIVTSEDILTICTIKIVNKVFDMMYAMSTRNVNEVMRLYGDLLALKESPMKIILIMEKQFAQLLAVRMLLDEGCDSRTIADRVGIRPYFINKSITQARGYSLKQLKQAVADCVEAEQDIKTGKTEDKYAIELLIVKYSTDTVG